MSGCPARTADTRRGIVVHRASTFVLTIRKAENAQTAVVVGTGVLRRCRRRCRTYDNIRLRALCCAVPTFNLVPSKTPSLHYILSLEAAQAPTTHLSTSWPLCCRVRRLFSPTCSFVTPLELPCVARKASRPGHLDLYPCRAQQPFPFQPLTILYFRSCTELCQVTGGR